MTYAIVVLGIVGTILILDNLPHLFNYGLRGKIGGMAGLVIVEIVLYRIANH